MMPVPLTRKNLDKLIYFVGTVSHRIEQFIGEFGEYLLALADTNYKRYFIVRYDDADRQRHGIINLTPLGRLRLQKILKMEQERKRRIARGEEWREEDFI